MRKSGSLSTSKTQTKTQTRRQHPRDLRKLSETQGDTSLPGVL